MDNGFDLKKFVNSYVETALQVAADESLRVDKKLTSGRFDEIVHQRVSESTGLPAEVIKKLHHPFHWAFFCSDGALPFGSPLELVQEPRASESLFLVGVRREILPVDREKISEYVLRTYSSLLEGKYRSLAA